MASNHFNSAGHPYMVDVSDKPQTRRRATARCQVRVSDDALRAIREGSGHKGDVLAIARLAGIQATKQTAQLIPLCHPIALDHVLVDVEAADDPSRVEIVVTTGCTGRTGVEMEAMTAAAAAGLTVYDMIKSVDRSASIERVELVSKDGGKSGPWTRPNPG